MYKNVVTGRIISDKEYFDLLHREYVNDWNDMDDDDKIEGEWNSLDAYIAFREENDGIDYDFTYVED